MIQANEIRLGNWVNFIPDNGNFIVSGIDSFNHSFKTINGLCTDDIRPIPLTKEILLKCGWVKNNNINSFEMIGECRMFLNETSFGYNMYNYILGASICKKIKYLHQLQNIYFALTQKELEINFDN